MRLGVVGAGAMGRHHVRIFSALTEVDLVGVSDLDRNNLTDLERLYSVATFLDYREMEGMVDAVSVAVPTSQHYEIAKFFMRRGVHVLIEKPLARTVEEAKQLIEIGCERDVKLQVGHIERFNPAVKGLPNILKNEISMLGPVIQMNSGLIATNTKNIKKSVGSIKTKAAEKEAELNKAAGQLKE